MLCRDDNCGIKLNSTVCSSIFICQLITASRSFLVDQFTGLTRPNEKKWVNPYAKKAISFEDKKKQ